MPMPTAGERRRIPSWTVVWAVFIALSCALGGCAVVSRYERETLADPAMDSSGDALRANSTGKFHGAREAAAGGNGRPSGGGCACGN